MLVLMIAAALQDASAMKVEMRQVGAVTPPGAPMTRRCVWRAIAPDGRTIEGGRPGSCAQSERAIRREAAIRLR